MASSYQRYELLKIRTQINSINYYLKLKIMKKSILTVFTVLLSVIITSSAWGQAPEMFNYQAVLRNNGDIIANGSVTARFTIHDGSASGTDVYQETQMLSTDQYGHIACAVGVGTVVSGDFSTIDWSNGGKYLQVEIDYGSGYEDLGASQLLSVPYALSAGGGDNKWGINGNATDSTNFIGTTNATPLYFKVNGWAAGFIDDRNLALGRESMIETGSVWNVGLGTRALKRNTTGNRNTAVGGAALQFNTEGVGNVAIGTDAMSANHKGVNNTAIGYKSDMGSDSLNNATAIGYRAFAEDDNTLILGSINGKNGATEDTKVGIGTTSPSKLLEVNGDALVDGTMFINGFSMFGTFGTMNINAFNVIPASSFAGIASLGSATNDWGKFFTKEITGTGDGLEAGKTLNIKSNAIISYSGGTIGNNFGFKIENSLNATKSINLQVGEFSGSFYMYNTTGTLLGSFDGTSGVYSSSSDERLKTGFQDLNKNTLEKLMQLKPVSYKYKSNMKGRTYIGFKAQEVEKIFPSLVYSPSIEGGNTGNYTLNYSGFGVIAVKAIQEQQKEINTLKEQNKKLQSQIDAIKEQLKNMAK